MIKNAVVVFVLFLAVAQLRAVPPTTQMAELQSWAGSVAAGTKILAQAFIAFFG